jgi:cyclase
MKLRTVFAALGLAAGLSAQGLQSPNIRALTEKWPETPVVNGIEIRHVQKDLYMLSGDGAIVAVQAGEGGVTLVDAGLAEQSDRLLAAVRTISRKPIRYVITTAADADKVGGIAGVVKAAGGIAGELGNPFGPNVGVMTISHEGASNQMSVMKLEPEGLPSSTFFTARKDFYSNGEPVEVIFAPKARTGGDVIVWFRGSDVVAAGDLFRSDSYPQFDSAKGGSLQGVIDGLNEILDIAIPERNQMGGTRVIPGHGHLCNEADVVEYRDMLTIIRDRVNGMIKKGMTLEQVKAAKPALEYDGIYGTRQEWPGDMFLTAVFNDLSRTKH